MNNIFTFRKNQEGRHNPSSKKTADVTAERRGERRLTQNAIPRIYPGWTHRQRRKNAER